jgi:2,3-bisphosphoglycerate-independent phosphoglycerate mutase
VAQLRPQAGLQRVPAFLRAGPPLAAIGAGVLERHTAELERGEAVASEITNEGWRRHLQRETLPVITAQAAGANLAGIAAAHDLTLFAHYSTDTAGHARDMAESVAALERVDAFLGGVLAALPRDTLVLLASDHGNIEDVRTGHTRNPALFMAVGPGHERVADGMTSLTDVAPALEAWLTADG